MQASPLLGICDGSVDKKKNTFYYTNKIGGVADLISGVSAAHSQCALCDASLSQIVQIYCPLAASPYHRTIHVFACANSQCSGKPESWKALRSQCLEPESKQTPARQDTNSLQGSKPSLSTTDWCDEADDWGMDSEETETGNAGPVHTNVPQLQPDVSTEGADVSSRLQGLSLNGSGDSVAPIPALTRPTFQPFYITVVEETDFEGCNDLEHANRLLKEYVKREGVDIGEIGSCKGGKEAEEKYERTEAKHGDTVFASFMKRISLCPEQVLRTSKIVLNDTVLGFLFHGPYTNLAGFIAGIFYSWSGSPLFIMEPPSNMTQMVPPCAHCGSPRVFEFQLMPALVSMLHTADINSDHVLEFGTVLVYTCRNSCWTSGSDVSVEEFVFVQADPDQKLFK